MILRTGVDLIEVARIARAQQRHGARFAARFFTPGEQADCAGQAAALAGRFAAKEAVAKALGTGIGTVRWVDIEVRRGPAGEPQLHLHGAAHTLAHALGLTGWALSLSHTHDHAIAFVVAYTATASP